MALSRLTASFLHHPEPIEGPEVPYQNDRKSNPAITGVRLLISALLLEWLGFLRRIIWFNAGFGRLRNIRHFIADYEPRYDPTVIPIAPNPSSTEDELILPLEETTSSVLLGKRYSVYDFHRLYKTGELTPTQVAEALLPLIRLDSSPPGEHSVGWFELRSDLILQSARASTERYRQGKPRGLLDGVPTAIKDEFDLEGYKTCLGSLNDYTGDSAQGQSITSWCVKKLEDSGAVILGKLSMHEFGLDTSGNNPNYGTPPNPYNCGYYTGGSSSGCAYAVSAGLIPIALGGDGGGSIRIPSSFCSVYGLKPSHGRVSAFPSPNHSITCAVNGPIAADMRSLAALYSVIAEPHSSSHFPSPSAGLVRNPRRILGVPEAWFSRASSEVQDLCRPLIAKLVSECSYHVVPIEIPFLVEGQIAHAMTVLTDAATLLPKTDNLTAANRILIALGTVTAATDYLLAQKLRQLLMQHLAYLWSEHPGMIIVTPTTSCAGWSIKDKAELKYGVSDGDQTLKTMEYVWMANFTGVPALTVPAGFATSKASKSFTNEDGVTADAEKKKNVPVGLMGMAEWGNETQLLQWGLEVEDLDIAKHRLPSTWVDVIAIAKQDMPDNGIDGTGDDQEVLVSK